ncbi:MAG: DUF1738 domain-containing protein [Synergistaceae bacterium]|nr:DUF1738 domain-containing protein [Synergistaceae bacterium]
MVSSNLNKAYRIEITEKIIEALKNGTAPWQKPWEGDNMPINATTGKRYRGINALLLSLVGEELDKGDDPRWATYLQAQANGWRIKKYSKATQITFWKPIEVNSESENENDNVSQNKREIVMKRFYVFHASQIEGIPPYAVPNKILSEERNQKIEEIIANSGADIRHSGFQAFYSAKGDFIQMPERCYFESIESYYATLLHELAHWTAHEKRLKRKLSAFKNSQEYAREELIVEILSVFLCSELGIAQTQEHFDNHASYVSSWIKILDKDYNAIFRASSEAERITEFIQKISSKKNQ